MLNRPATRATPGPSLRIRIECPLANKHARRGRTKRADLSAQRACQRSGCRTDHTNTNHCDCPASVQRDPYAAGRARRFSGAAKRGQSWSGNKPALSVHSVGNGAAATGYSFALTDPGVPSGAAIRVMQRVGIRSVNEGPPPHQRHAAASPPPVSSPRFLVKPRTPPVGDVSSPPAPIPALVYTHPLIHPDVEHAPSISGASRHHNRSSRRPGLSQRHKPVSAGACCARRSVAKSFAADLRTCRLRRVISFSRSSSLFLFLGL
ncbi:hypothetical protein BamIOP4010DRAFT_2359 [Burkholderia ambifaria IOP40-10]|uniref:Uncharacterized protein n=1 Tax=Burkholderia ambifaria IOP40-10 TaxID=396596 RepID=B1FE99_9BURK|nr:hypothetical protein BamIOP4010DRAFT_2359 [Burkholderia ambifaria IOP40-10]